MSFYENKRETLIAIRKCYEAIGDQSRANEIEALLHEVEAIIAEGGHTNQRVENDRKTNS